MVKICRHQRLKKFSNNPGSQRMNFTPYYDIAINEWLHGSKPGKSFGELNSIISIIMNYNNSFMAATLDDCLESSNCGLIETDYEELQRAFGEPHNCTQEGPWKDWGGDTRVTWAIKILAEGNPVTVRIYDSKVHEIPVRKVTAWSIAVAGSVKMAATFLASHFARYCSKMHTVRLEENRKYPWNLNSIFISSERNAH